MKKGSSIVIMPIILIICITSIIYISMYILNSFMPFMYHQKLNAISDKYMFVIEKYGYLTDLEKDRLISELSNSGFDINKIEIKSPNNTKKYGELINFEIKYTYLSNLPVINKKLENKQKETVIRIIKNSFSKI
ncbi:MAG: hypothetical protein RSE41_02025 [Clostridia bacterium]